MKFFVIREVVTRARTPGAAPSTTYECVGADSFESARDCANGLVSASCRVFVAKTDVIVEMKVYEVKP